MKKMIFIQIFILNFCIFPKNLQVAFFSPVPKGDIYWDEAIQMLKKSAIGLVSEFPKIFTKVEISLA